MKTRGARNGKEKQRDEKGGRKNEQNEIRQNQIASGFSAIFFGYFSNPGDTQANR